MSFARIINGVPAAMRSIMRRATRTTSGKLLAGVEPGVEVRSNHYSSHIQHGRFMWVILLRLKADSQRPTGYVRNSEWIGCDQTPNHVGILAP